MASTDAGAEISRLTRFRRSLTRRDWRSLGGMTDNAATGAARKPLSVGFWFSLGHCTIAIAVWKLGRIGEKWSANLNSQEAERA